MRNVSIRPTREIANAVGSIKPSVSKLNGTFGRPKPGKPLGRIPKLETVGTFKLKPIEIAVQIKIATKYPEISRDFFAGKGLNVNCIKMNGAIELAPSLGLAENIVDLVSTGKTLNANGLVEVEKISDISSRLVVNRTAFKTRTNEVSEILSKITPLPPPI